VLFVSRRFVQREIFCDVVRRDFGCIKADEIHRLSRAVRNLGTDKREKETYAFVSVDAAKPIDVRRAESHSEFETATTKDEWLPVFHSRHMTLENGLRCDEKKRFYTNPSV
jgi:hypothetical protein